MDLRVDISDASIKEFEGKPLCSECGRLIFDSKGENPRMIPGKWHGNFPKDKPLILKREL